MVAKTLQSRVGLIEERHCKCQKYRLNLFVKNFQPLFLTGIASFGFKGLQKRLHSPPSCKRETLPEALLDRTNRNIQKHIGYPQNFPTLVVFLSSPTQSLLSQWQEGGWDCRAATGLLGLGHLKLHHVNHFTSEVSAFVCRYQGPMCNIHVYINTCMCKFQ